MPNGRSEEVILREIGGCYGALSPENLSCDGEASKSYMARVHAQVKSQLSKLFKELGRTVSEDQYYDWAAEQREVAGASF